MTRFGSGPNGTVDARFPLPDARLAEVLPPSVGASAEDSSPLLAASFVRGDAQQRIPVRAEQTSATGAGKASGPQIPVMLPAKWFELRSFENAGRLWDVPSKLYQAALLNTVGRINHFSERLNYRLSSHSSAVLEQHILHTKQHESFHAVTQAVVTGLGIASLATGIPFLGGSSLLQVGIVVGLSGVLNGMSILHQRAQRGHCERILERIAGRKEKA